VCLDLGQQTVGRSQCSLVSQVAVDDVVDGCRMIFRQTTDRLQAGIREKLAAIGIDSDDISLDDVFTDLVDPFDGLETQHHKRT